MAWEPLFRVAAADQHGRAVGFWNPQTRKFLPNDLTPEEELFVHASARKENDRQKGMTKQQVIERVVTYFLEWKVNGTGVKRAEAEALLSIMRA